MAESHEETSHTIKKSVDESWKETVEKEKHVLSEDKTDDSIPEASFPFFISTLGMQALAALGEIENPAANEKKFEPLQAQYLIDTLQMISEKTKGNLSKDEAAALQDMLHTLRLKFVEKKQGLS